MASQPETFTTSTGHILSGGEWLDAHFEMKRPEYEAQLRAVGIQSGWHVLDAACGSGSYLQQMAELVGSTGCLAALDLAPDNVELVERRLAAAPLPCPIETRVGNVLDLPYPDDNFDAVWFANTSQYLTDEELGIALAEFKRVVRPGGLVAVKESDSTVKRITPAPPGLMLRLVQAAADVGTVTAAGTLRTPALPSWLRRSGLLSVWQLATPILRCSPFDSVGRTYMRNFLRYASAQASDFDLPAADLEFWAQLRDPAALERYLDDPDCSTLDINTLIVGTVPGEMGAASSG